MTAAPARAVPRRSAPAGRPRHLRVVRSSPRRRFRLTMFIAVVVSLVAVFGLVAFNVFLVQSQFKLEQIEQQLDVERQEFERLRLETAHLSSPERILALARQELGMVDPVTVTHLTAPSHEDDAFGPSGEGARAWAEVKPFLAAEP